MPFKEKEEKKTKKTNHPNRVKKIGKKTTWINQLAMVNCTQIEVEIKSALGLGFEYKSLGLCGWVFVMIK